MSYDTAMRLWRWLLIGAGIGALLMVGLIFGLYKAGYIEVISKVSSGGIDHGN